MEGPNISNGTADKANVIGRPSPPHPPRHKPRRAMPDDDTWLFASVMGFLKSPGWALPVMSFIDENSAHITAAAREVPTPLVVAWFITERQRASRCNPRLVARAHTERARAGHAVFPPSHG